MFQSLSIFGMIYLITISIMFGFRRKKESGKGPERHNFQEQIVEPEDNPFYEGNKKKERTLYTPEGAFKKEMIANRPQYERGIKALRLFLNEQNPGSGDSMSLEELHAALVGRDVRDIGRAERVREHLHDWVKRVVRVEKEPGDSASTHEANIREKQSEYIASINAMVEATGGLR
jgi:hypothetical protein